MQRRSSAIFVSLLCSAGVCAGCNLNQIAADQTASLLEEAAPALDGHWDYELIGEGTPGAIMQLEAMYSLSPDNEGLGLNLAKAYVGYGFGWVENELEIADDAADFDKADRIRDRARQLYLRARNLGRHAMRVRDPEVDEILTGDPAKLKEYLEEEFTDPEQDAAVLFWTAMGWGSAINLSLDDPDLIADAPICSALMTRVTEIDPDFFNASAWAFLGGLESAMPAALGGTPEKGKNYFEQGLQITERRNHMIHIAYAKLYAVNTSNRELYVKLLTEVLEAEDLGDSVRLNNKIARVRAERYLANVDELF